MSGPEPTGQNGRPETERTTTLTNMADPNYDNAIPVSMDTIWGVVCIKCRKQGTPTVWTIIINGHHYTRCDDCNIIMTPEPLKL